LFVITLPLSCYSDARQHQQTTSQYIITRKRAEEGLACLFAAAVIGYISVFAIATGYQAGIEQAPTGPRR